MLVQRFVAFPTDAIPAASAIRDVDREIETYAR
jgi:hypothetical protein